MKGAIMLSGGGSKLFAAIGVTYPAGSTLTCTNGTKTLTAKTTSGQWVFAIPEAGTWTVTATQGTNTKSKSVSITSEGQFESVELSYALVLFDGGDNTADSGGWGQKNSGSGNLIEFKVAESISIHMDQYAGGKNSPSAFYLVCYAKTKQTLDDYATLKVTFDKATSAGYIAVNSSIPTLETFSYDYIELFAASKSYKASNSPKTVELDISSFTGSYYVTIIVDGCSSSDDPTQITKVSLE